VRIALTLTELRTAINEQKRLGKKIGFVPTMGYLHEGHGSLITRAKAENDYVVLSIFVNPLQFGPNEDYERYPRDFAKDRDYAESLGVDLLFHPEVREIYPNYPSLTKVTVSGITELLCGASRPGHFEGVATIVAKLFNLVMPDRAYFGLKDAQQVAVIQQMVQDLNFPVEIVPCPIIREEDGLAKSSRNVYLNNEERKQAVILSQSLKKAKAEIERGERNAGRIKEMIREMILSQPLAVIDYIEILTFPSLEKIDSMANKTVLIALAVKFGQTRLIDNVIVEIGG